MPSMQENIENLMADLSTLFVRCLIDGRERKDFRTPPVVGIEVYAMPDDNQSAVLRLSYEASHRDSLLRLGGRKMLTVEEFECPRDASEFAYQKWDEAGLYQLFWQDIPAVACEIRPGADALVGASMNHWLLVAHMLRLQTIIDVELARQSFGQLMDGRLGTGQVPLLQPLSYRISGLVASLVARRLEVEA